MDRQTTVLDIYTFPEHTWSTVDLSGYSVEATDGGIGKIDDATYQVGSNALVVDTGPWIFGEKVMLPAGVVSRVNETDHKVWVNLTKDDIHNAPRFDESRWHDPVYRDEVGTYYMGRFNRPTGPDYGTDDRSNLS